MSGNEALEQGDSEVILFHIYASWSVDWTVGAGGGAKCGQL